MSVDKVTRKISSSFAMVFLCMALCMASLTGLSVNVLHNIVNGQKQHAESFVPAKRLTAGFEREVLNARIFFIYYVTIQKPGALENGWKRYRNGEDTLHQLAVLVNRYPDLANLRTPVAKLQQDVDNYGVALAATLNMVQGGETKGPNYDAQVKEWAVRGATMVADSASVESLTFTSGESDARNIAHHLKSGETRAFAGFGVSFFLSLLLTLIAARNLNHFIREGVSAKTTMNQSSSRSLYTLPLQSGALQSQER